MGAIVAVGSLIGAFSGGIPLGATTILAGGVEVVPAFLSFSTIGAGLGILGTAISGIQQASAQRAAGGAEQAAAEARARELRLKSSRERTQAAIDEADRQRRLRINLATQRARFAAGGVDPQTGSPLRIQESSISEILRQDRQAGLFSSLTVGALNRQASQEVRAGQAARQGGNIRARQTLFQTGSLIAGQFTQARDVGVI